MWDDELQQKKRQKRKELSIQECGAVKCQKGEKGKGKKMKNYGVGKRGGSYWRKDTEMMFTF